MQVNILEDNNELNKVRYECKKLITKAWYDPILSGVMFEYLYNYLNNRSGNKIEKFQFNDVEKFIDITFKINNNTKYISDIICAFGDLYKYLVYTPHFFNKLLYINEKTANMFSYMTTNYLFLINNNFSFYSILVMSNNDSDVSYRIKLV
jgi:hypothetical protein